MDTFFVRKQIVVGFVLFVVVEMCVTVVRFVSPADASTTSQQQFTIDVLPLSQKRHRKIEQPNAASFGAC